MVTTAYRRVRDARAGYTGWRVVQGSALIWALQSFVWFQGYGNLAVQLREQFGWSKTFFAIGFSATRAESALLGPPQGMALRRWGVTAMMRVGAVLMLIGYWLMATMSSQRQFLVALAFIALGSTLAGFLTITTAMVSWFERRRATALSIASMGFALGGFAGPLLVFAFNAIGWRATFAIAGTVLAAVAWILGPIIGRTREQTGEPVDGIDAASAAELPQAEGLQGHSLTASQALRTQAFWMISIGHGAALLVVTSVIAHLQLYLTEDLGYSARRAALVAGLVPIFQFIGTALGGPLGDRFNKRMIAAAAMVAHGVGLLMLTYATSGLMVGVFVVLHGLAWGSRGPQMQAIRADYFGTASFGTIMGLSSLITTLGAVVGPLLAGRLADSTGDYQLGFTILAVSAICGLVFFLLATPPKLRDYAEQDV